MVRALLPLPVIRPLSEGDIDAVLLDAGGRRTVEDTGPNLPMNADYLLGNAVIELKILDDEGLLKPERQTRIANLFLQSQPNRPVVVVDPRLLPPDGSREYARIMEGPIKSAVSKARAQLRQTRMEVGEDSTTVLFVINNGFAALNHEELVDHVVRRATNDSDQIDGVVIAGCYFHSDGFDTVSTWPVDYRPIRPNRPFPEFEALRDAWNRLADKHMTEFVRGEHGLNAKKGPVSDLVFDVDGVTFVKPAPAWGKQSDFYGPDRPRRSAGSFDAVGAVATTIPLLSDLERRRFKTALPDEPVLASREAWTAYFDTALATSELLRPVVPMTVTRGGWESWRRHHREHSGLKSIAEYANQKFNRRARELLLAAKEMSDDQAPPRRYVGIAVEMIGQDARNDVSHIAAVLQKRNAPPEIRTLVAAARTSHEGALALGVAYAIREGIDHVYYQHDLRFAWS